jgi:hypothetical protein
MKLLKKDIPARGALAVIGLALIASIVSGREQPQTESTRSPQTESARSPHTAPRAAEEASLADLDLAKLRRENGPAAVSDLLAPRAAPPPPPHYAGQAGPALAPPPPAPVAPPLPFAYLGKIIDGGKTTVFVARGADHYSVESGAEIDQYKVEHVTDRQITFVFRPLGMRQVLDVPQPGQEAAAR